MSSSQINIRTKQKFNILKNQLIFFLGILVAVLICNFLVHGKLLTPNNMKVIITHSVYYALVSWGMLFIFCGGLIDLSIGANILLSANFGVYLAMRLGLGYFGLIVGAVLCAVILECMSVFTTIKLKIPSWIAGLGMALIFEAILTIFSSYLSKTEGSSSIRLTNYRIFGTMPTMAIVAVIGFIITYILFNRSSVGLNIQAVGCNDSVSKAMGINKNKAIYISAIIGAVFIGIAAIVQISNAGRMESVSGLGSLSGIFKALATLLLAQSFARVISPPVGILISSIMVMGLFNVLTMLGVPSGTGQEMCLGTIIILCGIVAHWKYKGVVK